MPGLQAAIAAAIVIGSALAMEVVAGLVHRFWMHGPGWGWHRSHHQPPPGRRLQRNDLFAVVFAALAIGLMLVGTGAWWPLYWVGIGMTLYGLLYALLHDGLVHRRWPLRWMPRRGFLHRLVQAHRLHHAVTGRHGAVSFGFLYAPPVDRIAAALRQRRLGLSPAPRSSPRTRARTLQGAIGLVLASALIGAWALASFYGLFVHRWSDHSPWLAPALVALICWLDVGLFIVAHDAMHRSLVPTHRALNDALGRLCLRLYAGFSLGRLRPRHQAHHRHPGTPGDPEFHVESVRFWPWYAGFMRRYLGWREAAGLLLIFGLLTLVLRAPLANVLVFWAAPALLSSLQLFAFGTWLPHRKLALAFADRHRARSNDYGWWASLLSCFHFGYHHEHHLRPHAPWWRLPAVRRALRPSSSGRGASTGLHAAS